METDLLAQLIDAKQQVLRQLLDVSRRQQQIIAEKELTSLFSVLSAKQQILQVLQKIDQQLEPFRGDDPQQRQWRTESDRVRCREQAARCEAILKEILSLEKAAELSMVEQREQTATEIAAFQHHAQAERAYVGSSQTLPRTTSVALEG
jgi:hypothetical protein